MRNLGRMAPSLLAAAFLGSAATFAWLGGVHEPSAPVATSASPAVASKVEMALPADHPPIQGGPSGAGMELPPDHPSLRGGSPHDTTPLPSTEAPALSWKVPTEWQEAPNPNAMRLATYRIPGGAEMSVARAGGATEANIQRWRSQFDQAGADKREELTVRGFHVTVVQIRGTYDGAGMIMSGAPSQTHPDWGLLGAIVETAGSSYFFKLLGPANAIASARASFDALIKSVKPS